MAEGRTRIAPRPAIRCYRAGGGRAREGEVGSPGVARTVRVATMPGDAVEAGALCRFPSSIDDTQPWSKLPPDAHSHPRDACRTYCALPPTIMARHGKVICWRPESLAPAFLIAQVARVREAGKHSADSGRPSLPSPSRGRFTQLPSGPCVSDDRRVPAECTRGDVGMEFVRVAPWAAARPRLRCGPRSKPPWALGALPSRRRVEPRRVLPGASVWMGERRQEGGQCPPGRRRGCVRGTVALDGKHLRQAGGGRNLG